MRRRNLDGCPISAALQLIGDKWTLLVVRDLFRGPKRTTELLEALQPISSRTLLARLRDMERDEFVLRNDLGGSPPHVEYVLTPKGRLLVPVIEALKNAGEALGCAQCEDRNVREGTYCEVCPHKITPEDYNASMNRRDDSIVLL